MLAEKKSLKRFLLVYIVSTLFLIFIGEFFYYQIKYNNIISLQVKELKNELNIFFVNKKKIFINKPLPDNFQIAVFKDGRFIYGNFNPKEINFNKEFWIKDGFLYYIYLLPRGKGEIEVVAKKKFNVSEVNKLKKDLIIFTILATIFIIIIAFILGKIFLDPLKKSVVLLEEFIRDATHEMNTPISSILANIEILNMKNIDLKELKRIETSAKRLEKIFKDLSFLNLNHKVKKDIKLLNLKALLEDRLEFFSSLVENKHLKIKIDLEDLLIKADKEDIVRIFDNLISNAIKYSNLNETIFIELKDNYFLIKNRGKIKNLKNLTKKFYRENKNEGGFGLGLYIVKKICDSYGFDLKINNKNEFVEIKIVFKNSLS